MEIDVLSRFVHPNLIRALDIFAQTNGPQTESLNIVLPLADGTLETKNHLLSLDQKKLFCFQIASALSFLEAKGIYHCDIKPDNVLVYPGKAVVSDLGMSQRVGNSTPLCCMVALY